MHSPQSTIILTSLRVRSCVWWSRRLRVCCGQLGARLGSHCMSRVVHVKPLSQVGGVGWTLRFALARALREDLPSCKAPPRLGRALGGRSTNRGVQAPWSRSLHVMQSRWADGGCAGFFSRRWMACAFISAVNWCRQHRGGRALNAERRTRALLSGHQKRSTAVFYRRAFVARVAWTAETFEQPLPPRREWFFSRRAAMTWHRRRRRPWRALSLLRGRWCWPWRPWARQVHVATCKRQQRPRFSKRRRMVGGASPCGGWGVVL